MEQERPIYVITEPIRQAILSIIVKGVHPTVSFDQLNAIRMYLEELKPIQIVQDRTVERPTMETPPSTEPAS